MAIGYPLDKINLDQRLGSVVVQLQQSFDLVTELTAMLADVNRCSDAQLTAMGYDGNEISTIRAAFTALNNLWKISIGQMTQAAANDFWFDAKKLTGVVGTM